MTTAIQIIESIKTTNKNGTLKMLVTDYPSSCRRLIELTQQQHKDDITAYEFELEQKDLKYDELEKTHEDKIKSVLLDLHNIGEIFSATDFPACAKSIEEIISKLKA